MNYTFRFIRDPKKGKLRVGYVHYRTEEEGVLTNLRLRESLLAHAQKVITEYNGAMEKPGKEFTFTLEQKVE